MSPLSPSPTLLNAPLEETPWYWRRVDLFENVDSSVQIRMRTEAVRRHFGRGETICFADDAADCVFFLDSGLAKIEHIAPTGQTTTFWFCVPGDLFGAGGISGANCQSVYAKALEPSDVLILSRARFEKLIRDHPQLGLNVITFLSARLRLACDSMAEVKQRASLRVGRVILRLAETCGVRTPDGAVALQARISHQEIADMVNCTRQTVNEVLQSLVRQDIVHIEKRMIYIRKIEHLRSIVENAECQEGAALFPE